MRKHKTLEEYRQQGVKTPHLAWFLDRTPIYITFMIVALVACGFVFYQGYNAFASMSAPPEDDSPYRDTVAEDFLGQRFAADLVQQYPEEYVSDDVDEDEEIWEYDEEPRQNRLLGDVTQCPSLDGDIPASLLTSYQGAAGDDMLTVYTQVYAAGQARPHFETVREALVSCADAETTVTSTDTEFELLQYDDSAIFTAGDAIVEIDVSGDNTENKEDIVDFYAEYVEESLQSEQWQCLNMTPAIQDRARSFFFDFENYEGLFETELLEAKTETENLPTPVLTKDGNEAAVERINVIAEPDREAPEAPLPDDFEEIPEAPKQPAIPSPFEFQENFEDRARYEIVDIHGPGCGWEWTAQLPPDYDEQALENEQEATIVETQNRLEEQAKGYVFNGFDYSLRVMAQEPVISRWNDHVNTVNSTHEQWHWLEDEREALRPQWDQFLDEHREWRAFPQRQQDAADAYNQQVKAYEERVERFEDDMETYEEKYEQCMRDRDAVDQWEDRWGDAVRSGEAILEGEEQPEPSPSPSSTEEGEEDREEPAEEPTELPVAPERPDDCITLPTQPTAPEAPEKPAILDEEQGAEPQPPTIPEGVTVPNSWDNPVSN